jgi:hypothetical protein
MVVHIARCMIVIFEIRRVSGDGTFVLLDVWRRIHVASRPSIKPGRAHIVERTWYDGEEERQLIEQDKSLGFQDRIPSD